jgi:amino acid adenylation domain-containing protein
VLSVTWLRHCSIPKLRQSISLQAFPMTKWTGCSRREEHRKFDMSNFVDRISRLSPKQLLLLAVDQQERLQAAERRQREPIAIVGMSCRFPGGADSPMAFWDLLKEGRDAIRDVPNERWNNDALFDPDPDAPARISVRNGGFLDSVSGFDSAFFGVAPREAFSMDPQQRLLLEVAWEALEHAGVSPESLQGSAAGVFVGICNSEHFLRMLDRGAEAIDGYLASGNAPSVAAGRIAYCLGLQGPAMAIDTSCSSSLVALHLACRSLRNGETRLVLACGVNVMCAPETTIALSKAHMLAPDGRCKAFDAQADGYARGEGCGVLVLKRESDAVADGDNILALVRGTAVNQDGRSGGLTVPNGPAQESVIRAALADAGVAPHDIDYVEAHGTGTSLGDPIEVRALSQTLGTGRSDDRPLLIGSVKTNIGHLEGAAGIAGVIKVILSLQHERIPPHLHFRQPSPHIPWSEYRLAVTAGGHPWLRGARSRLAGVSSFGFSGTNAHVVLQEGPELARTTGAEPRSFHCVPLSARTDAALAELATSYAQAISSHPDLVLADIAYTAGAGRSHFARRLAVVAESTTVAADAFTALGAGKPHPALHTGIAVPDQPDEVVFLFAGQDAAFPGMGRLLYDTSRVYRDTIDQCDRLLGSDAAGRTLKSVLWPAPDEHPLPDDPSWAPPALFAVQYAAVQLWKSFGIQPAAVIGEADGEYVAACVAGVFSLEDGLRLIAEWGRTCQAALAPAAMAARIRSVAMTAPHTPIVWTAGGPGMNEAPDADYWQRQLYHPGRITDAITSLRQANYRSFLSLSPTGSLLATAKQSLPDEETVCLLTTDHGEDEWSNIAHGLAELYVRGIVVNWPGVSKGARQVPLPSYPFQHKNYWFPPEQLEGLYRGPSAEQSPRTTARRDDTAADSTVDSETDGLYYQVLWEPAPLPRRASTLLVAPKRVGPKVRERFRTLAREHGLSVYDRLVPELDRLSAEYVAKALRQIGFDAAIGRVFAVEDEASRLGVAPRHHRLFGRLIDMLAEDGVLRHCGSTVEVTGTLPVTDPEQHCDAALAMFGEVNAEVSTLRRCGSQLARVLTGEQDPLQLLFPGGSFTEARKLYIESPYARTYNTTLAEALTAAIEALPSDALLRVLEIGAGTGGTTSYVLPLLSSNRVEYTFTDISPLFLERAAEQFGTYPFLRTALLDIEEDPFSQRFQPFQFDVVIAANVLHATSDLSETIRHVRSLMAPNGMLFLLEGVAPQRWGDLTFGLTEGWWRFGDVTLRADYPLIDTQAWCTLLANSGFCDCEIIGAEPSGPMSQRQQALILARASAADQNWVLVGDTDGLGAALAERLRARGDAVTIKTAVAADISVPDGANLVYLGALELSAHQGDEPDIADLCAAFACELPLKWLAQFGRESKADRAWLVTRGAQPVEGRPAPDARWQSPLWGVGRVFSLERPDHWGGLVDLPPEGSANTLAETLLTAIDAGDDEDQAAYRASGRYVARMVAAPIPDALAVQIRSDVTYLITGGFGGLGLLVAHWMAERGARCLALLGRHPDPTSGAVREIEALGARVIPLAGDVADEPAINNLLEHLAHSAPPLRGIIHAATGASAASIEQLTVTQILETLRPKIAGTITLERVTRRLDLDFVVLFSSLAAILGASGQVHYAAANLFLDATAQVENRPGRRVLSINWGSWETVRMASEETRLGYRRAGLLPMSNSEALDALGRLLAGPDSQGIVARIDWSRYKPLFETRRPRPFLSCLGAVPPPIHAPELLETGGASDLPEHISQAPAAERPKLLHNLVRNAVAAVLGADEATIAPELDLFEAGMDSLMSIELKRRLEVGIERSLPSNLTFSYPTVTALSTFLAGLLEVPSQCSLDMKPMQSEEQIREPAGAKAKRIYPLSYSQKALWFLHQQAPQSAAYNISLVVRILSRLDVSALQQALQMLIDRHPILRTTYAAIDGSPYQCVADYQPATFHTHAIPPLDDPDLRERLESDACQPFDLAHGPVIRTSVYTRGPEDHVLLLSMHHIAVDGWSIMILIEELLKLHAELTGGPEAGLPQPERAYGDYARWQEQMLAGAEGDRLWTYWQQKLAPPRDRVALPTDHPKPVIQTFHGASLALRLEDTVTRQVMNVARQERTTAFVVLLAAFQVFLSRLSRSEDVIVGTSTFARSKPEYMRVVGDFVNSVPVRSHLSAKLVFRDFVRQVASTVFEAIDAQEFPLPLLVQRLQPERNASGSPLFDTFFSLLRFPQFQGLALLYGDGSEDVVEIGGLRLVPFPIEQGSGQFDLALMMVEIAGTLRGAFKYRTDLFEESTVRRFAADYLALVDTLTRNPDVALGEVLKPAVTAMTPDSIEDLLASLGKRDIRMLLEGDRLRINAPRGALDDAVKAAITARRSDIMAHLRRSSPVAREQDADTIRTIPRTGRLPVSSAQQRLWFLNQMEPGGAHYNIGGGIRLRGLLDIEILRQAIEDLVARHEAFRTRIGERDGQPWLEILETSQTRIDILDLSDGPAATREATALRTAEALLSSPLDMAQGPLAVFLLTRLAADDHMLAIAMHHVVSDGWSLAIASHEIWTLYDARVAGREAALTPLPVDYVDYAAWEQSQLAAGRMEEHLAYWKRQLQDAPAELELPTDRRRSSAASHRGGRLRCYFPAEVITAVETCSRDQGATLFMTLLAAWQVLMYRYSGQDDVLVGTPVANRDDTALEGIIGCLVNNVVMRGRLGNNPSFAGFLEQVKQDTLAAFDHRALPFDRVVQALNPERNAGHAPIFQVLFTLMSFPMRSLAPAGLSAEFLQLDTGAARFDLAIELGRVATGRHAGEFGAMYEYDSDLFDAGTIVRMHEHFLHLLATVAADPSCGVRDLALLTPADAQQLLEVHNNTAVQHDRMRCVHHLLEATAQSMPDAPAVIAGAVTLSYHALDQAANRLAHLLRRRGIDRGALVAVCLDRTVDIPIALAAVLKTGAAYVPLDPTHPEERLHYILADARVSCVITTSSFLPIFDGTAVQCVLLDEEDKLLACQSDVPPAITINPEDLAYVIYTSGSTGRPKGVAIEHRNVVSFLEAMQRQPGLTANDRLLAVTTLAFDIAGLEIWLPLSVGARIVIASRIDVLDGSRLMALLESHEITMLQATPASWRLLLEAGWTGSHHLKALCGGEALQPDLASALVHRVGELWNMYGPTETTIWSTAGRILDATEAITIGRPIANTQVFVLDHAGQLAPIGVVGELCIGGEGVARGYWQQPDLTAEKFIPIALPDGRTERLYRTGDMARFRADGGLELLGRRDHQVKVRGYRVELGEIEAVLATVGGVKECAVIVRSLASGDERLVGYVTLVDGALFDADMTRDRLRNKLPEYMVPALFVVLAAMPLTPNHKLDRKALPAPNAPDLRSESATAALMTPTQRRVARIWQEVLHVDSVGLNNNFFDLGGHSLLLVKLHAGLKREFATDLRLVELFQRTTVASQADRLSSASRSDDALARARTRAERQLHD